MSNKITNQVIEDYALKYWNTNCMYLVRHPIVVKPKEFFTKINDWSRFYYIQLRSIESITDEEGKYIMDILGHHSISLDDWAKKFIVNKSEMYQEVSDYLRSIGIATSFRGITVDEMIESGVLKLTK